MGYGQVQSINTENPRDAMYGGRPSSNRPKAHASGAMEMTSGTSSLEIYASEPMEMNTGYIGGTFYEEMDTILPVATDELYPEENYVLNYNVGMQSPPRSPVPQPIAPLTPATPQVSVAQPMNTPAAFLTELVPYKPQATSTPLPAPVQTPPASTPPPAVPAPLAVPAFEVPLIPLPLPLSLTPIPLPEPVIPAEPSPTYNSNYVSIFDPPPVIRDPEPVVIQSDIPEVRGYHLRTKKVVPPPKPKRPSPRKPRTRGAAEKPPKVVKPAPEPRELSPKPAKIRKLSPKPAPVRAISPEPAVATRRSRRAQSPKVAPPEYTFSTRKADIPQLSPEPPTPPPPPVSKRSTRRAQSPKVAPEPKHSPKPVKARKPSPKQVPEPREVSPQPTKTRKPSPEPTKIRKSSPKARPEPRKPSPEPAPPSPPPTPKRSTRHATSPKAAPESKHTPKTAKAPKLSPEAPAPVTKRSTRRTPSPTKAAQETKASIPILSPEPPPKSPRPVRRAAAKAKIPPLLPVPAAPLTPAPATPTDSSYALSLPSPAPSVSDALVVQNNSDSYSVISQVDLVLADIDAPAKPDKRLLEVHANQKANPPEIPERDGKILRLTLYNFLSHFYFGREWNRSINYITGANGSGKSAVCAAIGVVLGVKASQSGRSLKIAGLINNKRASAKVEITLSNAGTLNIAKYGNRIIIAREIGKNSSKFKIAKGKLPPEKNPEWRDLSVKELDMIKNTLGIRPDNLCQILKQSDMKPFFLRATPKDCYTIYYEATGLIPCELEVEKAYENLTATKTTFGSKKIELSSLIVKRTGLQKELEKTEAMENLAPKIETLEKECAWATVKEEEEEYKTLTEEGRHLNETVDASRKKRLEADKNLKALKSEYAVETKKCNKMKADLAELEKSEKEKSIDMKNMNSDIKKTKNKMEHLDQSIRSLTNNVEEVRKTMRAAGRHQEEREELNKRINELAKQIRIGTEKIKQLGDSELKLKLNIEECEKMERDSKLQLQRLNKMIEENKKEGESLKKSKGDKYNNWPPEIKLLTEKMEASTFKKKPYGPMCRYYTVKDEKWRGVIESMHSNTLFSFCTDNIDDKEKLVKLINEVFKKDSKVRYPEVYISPYIYKKHKIASRKADGTKYPTLYDMVDIQDDPVIFNWIIDRLSIEQRLLIENQIEAAEFMRTKEVPQHCVAAYTLNYYTVLPFPNLELWANNQPKANQPQYLKLSTDDSLAAGLRQLDEERRRLQEEHRELTKKHKAEMQNTASSKELYENCMKMPNSKDKTKEVNQLKSEQRHYVQKRKMVPDPASQNEEIQADLEEIHKKEEERKILSKKLDTQCEEVSQLEGEIKKLRGEYATLKSEIQEMVDNEKYHNKREAQLKQVLKNCETNLDRHKADKDALDKKLKVLKIYMEEKTAEAEKLCEKITDVRDTKTIKEELETLKIQLKSWKDKILEKNKLVTELTSLDSKTKEITAEIKFFTMLTKFIGATLKNMDREIEKSKCSSGTLLMGRFVNMATVLNTTGKIDIDHKEKTLTFALHPDSQSQVRASRNFTDGKVNNKETKNYAVSLSGGERVLATFFFLLATWKAMESPFHIVDEMDVFLDEIRQEDCLGLLFKQMVDTPEAQFFVISPLEVTPSEIPPPERYCHIRLADPKKANGSDEEDTDHEVDTELPD